METFWLNAGPAHRDPLTAQSVPRGGLMHRVGHFGAPASATPSVSNQQCQPHLPVDVSMAGVSTGAVEGSLASVNDRPNSYNPDCSPSGKSANRTMERLITVLRLGRAEAGLSGTSSRGGDVAMERARSGSVASGPPGQLALNLGPAPPVAAAERDAPISSSDVLTAGVGAAAARSAPGLNTSGTGCGPGPSSRVSFGPFPSSPQGNSSRLTPVSQSTSASFGATFPALVTAESGDGGAGAQTAHSDQWASPAAAGAVVGPPPWQMGRPAPVVAQTGSRGVSGTTASLSTGIAGAVASAQRVPATVVVVTKRSSDASASPNLADPTATP